MYKQSFALKCRTSSLITNKFYIKTSVWSRHSRSMHGGPIFLFWSIGFYPGLVELTREGVVYEWVDIHDLTRLRLGLEGNLNLIPLDSP